MTVQNIRFLVVAALSFSTAASAASSSTGASPGATATSFYVPRGIVVLASGGPGPSIMKIEMISTGDRLVPLESDEGQAIYRENKPSAVRRHFIRSTE